MKEYKTNYKNWIIWYDLFYEIIKPDDLLFYQSYITNKTKDVLEMGIGTGRVFQKFINKKINWTGIDDSEEMINLCKEKIEPKQPLIGKLKLINDDMTKLDIKENEKSIYNSKFDLVIYPSNSIMSVGNITLQKDALCSGIKNSEYRTITAEDKAIAAITFFESIFTYSSFLLGQILLHLLRT